MTPPRASGIDVTRAAAALAVLASHLVQTLTWRLPGWEVAAGPAVASRVHSLTGTLGDWGVGLFLVVSGVCIHLPMARRLAASQDARLAVAPYLRRRFVRIYPPYVAAMAVSAAVAWALPEAVRRSSLIGVPTLAQLASHLLLVHTAFIGHAGAVSGVLWTIALEAHFYLLYPALLVLRRRVGIGWTCAVLLAVAVVSRAAAQPLLSQAGLVLLGESFLRRTWEFGLGMWVAERLAASGPDRQPWPRARLAWSALAVVTLAGGLALALLPGGLRLRAFLWPPLFAIGVAAAARWTVPAAWPERAARWLGERSYSLYLVHPVGLALGLWAWSAWHGPRLAGAALMLGCTALLFVVFYGVVERRFAAYRPEVGPGAPAASPRPW